MINFMRKVYGNFWFEILLPTSGYNWLLTQEESHVFVPPHPLYSSGDFVADFSLSTEVLVLWIWKHSQTVISNQFLYFDVKMCCSKIVSVYLTHLDFLSPWRGKLTCSCPHKLPHLSLCLSGGQQLISPWQSMTNYLPSGQQIHVGAWKLLSVCIICWIKGAGRVDQL